MKLPSLLTGLALAAALSLPLPALAQAASALKGEVLETLNVESYTYLRIKTASGEVWAAVPTAAVKPGAQVSIVNPMMMSNFESRTLKRRFDQIAFGQLAGAGAAPGAAMPTAPTAAFGGAPGAMQAPTMPGKPPAAPPPPNTKVPKASGPDARTVAEVMQGRAKLKDKTVVVHGRVIKVNTGIMGKNWLHLQDGSGSPADRSDDLLVTTKGVAAVGDIVTVRGTVRTDVNLGAGYSYEALVEEATVTK